MLPKEIPAAAPDPIKRPAITATGSGIFRLIANAVTKLYKKAVVDKLTLAIFLIVMLGSYFLDLSPVVFVILAAFAGIFLQSKGGAGK